MPEHMIVQVTGAFEGSITTDDLIPSGEASSHRSDPNRIAEYLLIGRDKEYVGRAKALRRMATGGAPMSDGLCRALRVMAEAYGAAEEAVGVGGLLYADVLGDGSSREQAASSQRILGTFVNVSHEYATKRYRSNLINWGLLPLTADKLPALREGDIWLLPNARKAIQDGAESLTVYPLAKEDAPFTAFIGALTEQERAILLDGCVINHYAEKGTEAE